MRGRILGGWVIAMAIASWAVPAPQADVRLLREALLKTAQDLGRWAYTQTTVATDPKGRTKEQAIVRFDPSKPYEEQFEPIEVDGRAPTAKDIRNYRREGRERGEREENPDKSKRHKTLGELLEVDRATLSEENNERAIYDVPLREADNGRLPPEKFRVLVRVDKTRRAVEQIAVRLKEPMRAKMVVKVKSGEATLDFGAVEPQHAPVLKSIRGDARASILLVPVGGSFRLERTDHKRVKPYAERFGVKIGEIEAIDF